MKEKSYRQQLEAICNNASMALFIMNDRQHCTYMNPAAVELTGFSFEEVQGRPLHDVIHHTRPDGSHYPLEECPIDRAFPKNNQERGEDVFVHKDGHFYDVAFTASPIRENGRTVGTVIEVQDITERKRREANQTFLTTVADDLARLSNEDEIITSVGEALGKFLDISCCFYAEVDSDRDTATIDYMWRVSGQPDRRGEHRLSALVTEEFKRSAHAGEALVLNDTEADARTDEQGYRGIHAFITVPFHRYGQWKYLLTVNDTKPRDWREDQVELLKELAARLFPRLERARAEMALRDSDRRKDEFLAMLAHELRNPLAAICNGVQLLGRSVEEPQLAQWVDMLRRQSGKLAGMVDDLLDVSRVTRGIVALKPTRVDLVQIVSNARQSVQPLMDEKSHQLATYVPADPVEIDGDPVRLEQILVNLLTNAAKYTDPAGRVEIHLQAGEERAELRVADNGIGLGADTLAQIFDLFGQAERGLARSEGGLGIGLTIVKRLVELHGGDIEARSAGLGAGAEFMVSLPLAKGPAPVNRCSEPEPNRETGKRVLIVDDNEDVAITLALLLEATGHQVAVAHDGPSALTKAEEIGPELILLDIGLPIMDGYEVARRLRERPSTQGAVLAALTGYGQARDRERANAAGFDAHFVKPVDFGELEAFIRAGELQKRTQAEAEQ